MKIISFVTQKGGSGKTTLAICLAACAAKDKEVLLLDMDGQETATSWYKDREAKNITLVRVVNDNIQNNLKIAEENKIDYVFIDTPGRDELSVSTAIKSSDFCIIPCRPTPADMKATPVTVNVINRLNKNYAFVINQAPPRGQRIKEAVNGLSILGTVSPIYIVNRSAYQDAQGLGQGVTEFEPEGKAADETNQLWKWVLRQLEKC